VTRQKIGAVLGASALTVVLAACGSSSSSSSSSGSGGSSAAASGASSTFSGAGSTFAAPVYEQWGSQGFKLNYQAVGSGAGLTALEGKTVDFGASDPALKPADTTALAKVGAPIQIPMFFGAITVSYNLPGVNGGLKLNGTLLSNIYFGTVKTWNDPQIKALNPGVNLPSTAITVIHRSDSSGTTAGFTKFLAATDPAWASKVGTGKDVSWPTGTGAKGNAGVAGAVQQTPGAIGYVEQAYALEHKFTTANVKNSSGNYVPPTLASTTAAAVGIPVPADLGISAINSANPAAYPIVSQTFIVSYKDPCKAGIPGGQGAAQSLVKFLSYGLGAGQSILAQAFYAQLPPAILAKSKAAAATITCNGAPITG
jgi:phosphate transport system substrate-binding protein